MGVNIFSVFQKMEGDTWVDVESNYTEDRDYPIYSWLGLGGGDRMGTCDIDPLKPLRGFPKDFAIVDECYHPTTVVNHRHLSHFHENCVFMGEWGYSWLLAREILAAPIPKVVRTVRIPANEYLEWNDPEYYPWQWATTNFGHKVAMPDRIITTSDEARFEWDYDFTEDFSYFIDEVRRLSTLHGEIRVIFGFG